MLRYLSLWDDLYIPSSHNELDILFLCETVSLFLPGDSMDADKKYFCENSSAIPSVYVVFWRISVIANEMIFDSSYFSPDTEL